jgi:RNA polymerase sigma-70 factor (ECF subfamily)
MDTTLLSTVTSQPVGAFSLSESDSRTGTFSRLYDELQPQLLRYLGRLTGDADAAADVAQEAFMRLLQRPELSGEGARLWLFTVATNLVRDRGRAATRHQRILATGPVPVPSSGPLPDEQAERAEQVARVRAALDQLSERDRQILLMREEGFHYGEIARVIEVAPSSVGTLIARALRRFSSAYRSEVEE